MGCWRTYSQPPFIQVAVNWEHRELSATLKQPYTALRGLGVDLGRFEGIWGGFKGFGVVFGVLEDLQPPFIQVAVNWEHWELSAAL